MMHIGSKFISTSLFLGVILLIACSEKPNPIEENLKALEQSCIKLANLEGLGEESASLCACLTPKIRTNYSEEEQRIVAAVMSEGASRMEAGEKNLSETVIIEQHSDLNKDQSQSLANRVTSDIRECER